MKVIIQPSSLKGSIQAAASKSSMQRACAAALLHKGSAVILNPGHSNDDRAALGIIQKLGAKIEIIGTEMILVNSPGFPGQIEFDTARNVLEELEVNCGESGLSIRMFTPLISLSDKKITINGTGSLLKRPMNFFDEILPKLGVRINSNKGMLPLIVQGPLQPINIEVDGSLSSQFLTGLLMAYSATFRQKEDASTRNNQPTELSIRVRDLTSKPYIDLTLDVMRKFRMPIPENRNYEEFLFRRNPGTNQAESAETGENKQSIQYTVEGDWSGGAFLLVAGAIAGPIMVRGLDLGSTQADRAIVDALMAANAGIAMEAKGIRIHPAPMFGFEFDATDCPDLFPPLVALAAYCQGQTKLKGVNRLTHKESNRAISLQEEFAKMNVAIELQGDTMIIHGGRELKGSGTHSHHDHRIAMACAVAALKAGGETTIEEAEAVDKSYPDFYDDLKKLGADVSLYNKFKFNP